MAVIRVWVDEDHITTWMGSPTSKKHEDTWLIPSGLYWLKIRDRLEAGSKTPYNVMVLSQHECAALLELFYEYRHLLDAPTWAQKQIKECIEDKEY